MTSCQLRTPMAKGSRGLTQGPQKPEKDVEDSYLGDGNAPVCAGGLGTAPCTQASCKDASPSDPSQTCSAHGACASSQSNGFGLQVQKTHPLCGCVFTNTCGCEHSVPSESAPRCWRTGS